MFGWFKKNEKRREDRREEFERLGARLREEEFELANAKVTLTDIGLPEASVGDQITMNDVVYEVMDIIEYFDEDQKKYFTKYELAGDKESIWLRVSQDRVYRCQYITWDIEELSESVVYDKETYNYLSNGIVIKESARKYDDGEIIDKTCDFCTYKSVSGELLYLEATDNFRESSLCIPIIESDMKVQKVQKVRKINIKGMV